MIIELTSIEAQDYAEALVRLSDAWYTGKKHDRHLLQKHLGQYNALRDLIGKLNEAIRESKDASESTGSVFDLDLVRENEAEARELNKSYNEELTE